MKKLFFLLIIICQLANAQENLQVGSCSNWASWFRPVCHRLCQLWNEGRNELYLSGYAWHNRYTYSRKRLATYNELAWGGGMGKDLFDEDGDLHSLYAFAFSDSHKNMEPVLGYSFLKTVHFNFPAYVGAGFAMFITSRPDIHHWAPIPGILPWISIGYRRVSLCATYIPGHRDVGNVLFIVAKVAI